MTRVTRKVQSSPGVFRAAGAAPEAEAVAVPGVEPGQVRGRAAVAAEAEGVAVAGPPRTPAAVPSVTSAVAFVLDIVGGQRQRVAQNVPRVENSEMLSWRLVKYLSSHKSLVISSVPICSQIFT